jgi:hypothetical protein
VLLSFDTLDGILQEVLRGFGAVPKRGAEVGGLLLGRVQGTTVIIDAYETVPCDYKQGPSYLFTASDRVRLEDAIRKQRDAGLLVGYFRSDTREQFELADEDIDWMDRRLPGASAVVLLIRPYATKVSRAGFFLRGTNGRFPRVTPNEFPFSRKLLGGGSKRRDREEPAAETTAAPAAAPAGMVVRANDPAPAARRGLWAASLTLAAALGAGAGFFSGLNAPRLPDPALFKLALRVTPQGDDLRVEWDGSSPAVLTAQRGRLRIRMSGSEQLIPLDLEVLRNGLAIYRGAQGPVRFDLEVDQIAGGTLRESASQGAASEP